MGAATLLGEMEGHCDTNNDEKITEVLTNVLHGGVEVLACLQTALQHVQFDSVHNDRLVVKLGEFKNLIINQKIRRVYN